MARIWEDLGIVWEAESVQKQSGANASDRRPVATAQLPRIVDLDKASKAGIDILAWLNASNSMRVRAQAIARSNAKATPEAMKELVFNALIGVRATGGTRTITVEKIVRNLPDGSIYEGNDEMEYRQAFVAALVDMGVPIAIAQEKATAVSF